MLIPRALARTESTRPAIIACIALGKVHCLPFSSLEHARTKPVGAARYIGRAGESYGSVWSGQSAGAHVEHPDTKATGAAARNVEALWRECGDQIGRSRHAQSCFQSSPHPVFQRTDGGRETSQATEGSAGRVRYLFRRSVGTAFWPNGSGGICRDGSPMKIFAGSSRGFSISQYGVPVVYPRARTL